MRFWSPSQDFYPNRLKQPKGDFWLDAETKLRPRNLDQTANAPAA